jgi:hypothetical protein
MGKKAINVVEDQQVGSKYVACALLGDVSNTRRANPHHTVHRGIATARKNRPMEATGSHTHTHTHRHNLGGSPADLCFRFVPSLISLITIISLGDRACHQSSFSYLGIARSCLLLAGSHTEIVSY